MNGMLLIAYLSTFYILNVHRDRRKHVYYVEFFLNNNNEGLKG